MAAPENTDQKLAAGAVGPRSEVMLGTLTAVDKLGAPSVDWPGNPQGRPVPALSTALLDSKDVGRTAALLFAGGDPAQPLIVGLICQSLDAVLSATVESSPPVADLPRASAVQRAKGQADTETASAEDPERLVLTAGREVVIRCGDASITLTKSGKIIQRGAYVLSRSTGVNRIKGGSVQIN